MTAFLQQPTGTASPRDVRTMAFPHSHKTVLVLDRSPNFLQSSKQNVEFDVFTKSRTPGIIPLAPIVKSLWTCNVEAAIEYCRIVYDVYPQNKLVSTGQLSVIDLLAELPGIALDKKQALHYRPLARDPGKCLMMTDEIKIKDRFFFLRDEIFS